MKNAYFLLFLLVGCAQLTKGETQPVLYKNVKEKILFTSCSGAVETWADCYVKAKRSCELGYKIIEEKENAQGGIRELTFQCKK